MHCEYPETDTFVGLEGLTYGVTVGCNQSSLGTAVRKALRYLGFTRFSHDTQIYEGTNQIQRVVIAKNLLK